MEPSSLVSQLVHCYLCSFYFNLFDNIYSLEENYSRCMLVALIPGTVQHNGLEVKLVGLQIQTLLLSSGVSLHEWLNLPKSQCFHLCVQMTSNQWVAFKNLQKSSSDEIPVSSGYLNKVLLLLLSSMNTKGVFIELFLLNYVSKVLEVKSHYKF